MNDLTLIIPAKNESESLPAVIDSLEKYNFNLVIKWINFWKKCVEIFKTI